MDMGVFTIMDWYRFNNTLFYGNTDNWKNKKRKMVVAFM